MGHAASKKAETPSGASDTKATNSTKATEAPESSLEEKARTSPKNVTDDEWRELLNPEEYEVARRKGTERAFTGRFWNSKDKGIYMCVCCSTQLFSSSTKYDSGSGWPSFYDTVKKDDDASDDLNRIRDSSHGSVRTEVVCSRCGSHLGHVFNDGPNPTGLRYCINSASLKFKKEEQPEN